MDVVTAGTKTNERKLTYLSHDQKQSPDFASEEKEKPSCREGFSLYF